MPRALLSPRQLEVLSLLFVGKTNGEISQVLGTKVLTVKNQVNSVVKRLNANNRGHAVYRALVAGILRVPDAGASAPPPAAMPASPVPKVEEVADWLELGNLRVSASARSACTAWGDLDLRGRAFDLLLALALAGPRISTYRYLEETLWSSAESPAYCARVAAARIQRALRDAGADRRVECVRGIGYRLAAGAPPPKRPGRRGRAA